MPKTERLVFEWQQSRSEASRAGWEHRWERGEAVGPKGKEYLEREFGPVDVPPDDYEDFDDYWDFEDEEYSP